jgi:hypothetical protein
LRPKLTLSKEDLIALRAEAFDINVVLDLGVEKAIGPRRAPKWRSF